MSACAWAAGALLHPAVAQYDPSREPLGGGRGAPLADARGITLGTSVSHDSNLFRDATAVRDPQSETITTGSLGLRVDKPYAQQRFFFDATATAYRYNRFSHLNFNGLDYQAAWYWHLTPRLSGAFNADHAQMPTQFHDTGGQQSNVSTNERYVFRLDGHLFGGWHALLGASQSDQASEQSILSNQPDYRESGAELGVRFVFRSGSEFAVGRRKIEGDQDSQLINNVVVVGNANYQEDQNELRANWKLSLKSDFTGRATHLDRRYKQSPENNFQGTAGELGYVWLPTSKLSLRFAGTRNIVAWQGSPSSNYRVSNTFLIAPTWQATSRASVRLRLQRTNDDYPGTAAMERRDTTTIATLGVNWLPQSNVSIIASIFRERRSSNEPLFEYDATVARLGASVSF